MLFVIIWIGSAVACNRIATSKGKNPTTWTILGLCFGFLAVIAALVVPAGSTQSKPTSIATPNFPTPTFSDPTAQSSNGFPQPQFSENPKTDSE